MKGSDFDNLAVAISRSFDRRSLLAVTLGGFASLFSKFAQESRAQPTCGYGEDLCPSNFGGYDCIRVNLDDANCGFCGNRCDAGTHCNNGICGCGDFLDQCPGTFGNDCVDLKEDGANCGFCGNQCDFGAVCWNGNCGCGDFLDLCPGAFGGATCIDTFTDPDNCGACGIICPTGSTCASGSCFCRAGSTDCLDSSQCSGGICECQYGKELCPTYSIHGNQMYECQDLRSDSTNCGQCGNVCISGARCQNGNCDNSPPTTQAEDEELPFGLDKIAKDGMTFAEFAAYLPKEVSGLSLIPNAPPDIQTRRLYAGTRDNQTHIYGIPNDPQRIIYAWANCANLVRKLTLEEFLVQRLTACTDEPNCTVVAENLDTEFENGYLHISSTYNNVPEPVQILFWGPRDNQQQFSFQTFGLEVLEVLTTKFVENGSATAPIIKLL